MRALFALAVLLPLPLLSACSSHKEPPTVCGPWRPIGVAHWSVDPSAVTVPPMPGARC